MRRVYLSAAAPLCRSEEIPPERSRSWTGAWLGRRWGEYFAMVATSVFLPYEVYDLTVKITWLRLGALLINLLLVVYLAWSKRLFGLRGGKAAHQARLRSESVIEVEQAALAATLRPAVGMPHLACRFSLPDGPDGACAGVVRSG